MNNDQTIQVHRNQPKKFRSQQKFTQKEVDLAETPLFFPEGYEKIFLAIYFVTLPYIAGLLFLFFYVAEGSVDLFLSLNEEQAFMLTWAIGYEIIAALILLWIVKMSFSFANENRRSGAKKQFRRPGA